MALAFELVDAVASAEPAGRILQEAWTPPALHYTPEYLRWQLSFPAPAPLPAVMAFDASEPVGFAGITARRLRFRSFQWDSGIVSFVAVRPAWRGKAVAAGLYARLLSALRAAPTPIVTFAAAGSAGERALLRAYPEAGFCLHALGAYSVYGGMAGAATPRAACDWDAIPAADAAPLPALIERCAAESTLIWNDPSPRQWEHYFRDPRPRKLILLQRSGRPEGAAWAVRVQTRTTHGIETVTTIESVLLPRDHTAALPPLLQCAAGCWPSAKPIVISAPNLHGFDSTRLRQAGIRQIAASFHAQLCAVELPEMLKTASGTNLEVV